MSKGLEFSKGAGLSDMRDLVFDVVGKTVVKVVPEGTFSIAVDL